MHPWHDTYIDDATIATAFPVIIEIPKGSTKQVQMDKETGLLRLDRVLHSAVYYPADYGFIPLYILRRRRPPRCAWYWTGTCLPVDNRPGSRDWRYANARREGDRRQDRSRQRPRSRLRGVHGQEATAFPTYLQLRRFFEDYKVLEQKQVVVDDLQGPADAIRIIAEALELYRRLRRREL